MDRDETDLSNVSNPHLDVLKKVNVHVRPEHDDLVSANNEINDKLNGMPEIVEEIKSDVVSEDKEKAGAEDKDDTDEIDDDWFLKLVNSKDGLRISTANGNSDTGTNNLKITPLCDEDEDFKEKRMKSIRDGLKKIWKRGSATITVEDPIYKVSYLGNVLTGWAKGEGCIEKPLSSLWKNYHSSSRPDVQMKISVTQSGLKAVTKDHGLIEYWSHRITYCTVPSSLPKIFCWIYRHEGRKLKQELRCHAILCSKESMAARMATTLKLRLAQALLEFKRDKLLRQNARLSLVNSVYDNPSLPRRKILLSTGSHNYKPPLERSKSAPKLMSIEESLEEEESTPKLKKKFSGIGSGEGNGDNEEKTPKMTTVREGENRLSRTSLEEKCEYRLTNLNFVKKLCSSIENLVESTSNYGKKFFTERKSGKDICLPVKKSEDSILKKVERREESGAEDIFTKFKPKKNVYFDVKRSDDLETVLCTDFKKLEDEPRLAVEITLEVRDQESDENTNSLQSISSCSSEVSSLVTSSSEKSYSEGLLKSDGDIVLDAKDSLNGCENSIDRLQSYLSSCSEGFSDPQVILHPTGQRNAEGGEDESDAFRENEPVELMESSVKRLSLDRKEKDIPYHKIIKSTALSAGHLQSSCLQI